MELRKEKTRLLFVCLGNICRSPAAEGVMKHLVHQQGLDDRFEIDSAGTYGGHAGEPADGRMRQAAKQRGYRLDSISRQIKLCDFEMFDHILVMDDRNYDQVRALAPDLESRSKVQRMADYCKESHADHIPDPYYGGAKGFDLVLDLLEEGCSNLLNKLSKE